jgi:hypothetical protein
MQQTIKIPSAEKMQKYPWGVTVVSLFAVVVLLLYTVLKKGDCEDCERRYEAERSKNDMLTTSLLIKNGIIYKQAVDAVKKDSITTIKLNKSKEIVKGK